MHKYNNIYLTPLVVILGAYIYLSFFIFILYQLDFYHNSEYFRWGPPVIVFRKIVNSTFEFYFLLSLFFFNKMINTLITEVVYTWIVNCIQDPKSNNTYYSKNISLLIILLNSGHLSINFMFAINSLGSQISFLIVDFLGNILVIFYTNKCFIDRIHNENVLLISN